MCRLKQAAEKVMYSWWIPKNHPSGAKAQIDIAAFTARLKPCPFKADVVFRSL
jgi:hypothetical protein